jgi:hypothetical protein
MGIMYSGTQGIFNNGFHLYKLNCTEGDSPLGNVLYSEC